MHVSLGKGEPSMDYRLPWELKRQILGLRGAEWAPIVLQYYTNNQAVTEKDIQALWENWEQNLTAYCDRVQACPGAAALVQALAAAGIPMAIATSSRQASVDTKRKLHEESMFRHITAIVCGDHVAQGKPAPDIYLQAAAALGVDPAECLVVEDALTGVRAGRAAGCTVLAVPDSRFDSAARAVFEQEAQVVLPSLWHFSGKQFGIEGVEMQAPPTSSS